MMHVNDGQMYVYGVNHVYDERNIIENVALGSGSIMVRGCVSHDCQIDLKQLEKTQRYQRDILEASVVPNFDSNSQGTRPVFIDEWARTVPVHDYLNEESITTLVLPACSPD